MNIVSVIASITTLSASRVEACLKLLDEGCTLPFIARYRKEVTSSLTETEIHSIMSEKSRLDDLLKRKETVLSEIESQGKLTTSLQSKIEECLTKQELENLYLPFKPTRATRASKAIDAGLKPTADFIRSYSGDRKDIWKERLPLAKLRGAGFSTDEAILQGLSDIIAAEASENIRNRESLRKEMFFKGAIESKVTVDFKEQATPFNLYYDKSIAVKHLKSHQILALFRGESEKILRLKFSYDADKITAWIRNSISRVQNSIFEDLFVTCAADSLKRLLGPSIEKEVRSALKEQADTEAIEIFSKNLQTVLMAPPAGTVPVLAIDPGFRTGCKVAMLSKNGSFEQHKTIYPTEPRKDIEGSKKVLLNIISTYKPAFIAIGNGTGGRETELFVKEHVLPHCANSPAVILVNEAGASVYSASEIALKEFPDLDITVRGAISIGRRLQDPLVELVKIDPKSIGVGQYQHDVDQKALKNSLITTVESCVNSVGVNLNLASAPLLERVSGLSSKMAENIVQFRSEVGGFSNRNQLKKVKGVGPKAFEQCAGFLRISKGDNPLDNSAVHPESYDVVKKIAKSLSLKVEELLANPSHLDRLKPEQFTDEKRGVPTVLDIFDEIRMPGRDPREEFHYATFDDAVNSIDDLHEDMQLQGVVTNVTAFGAFVDIGVHQDGLVHISELADRFVSSPSDIVNTGDLVTVRVLEVEKQRKRISLSMKNLHV